MAAMSTAQVASRMAQPTRLLRSSVSSSRVFGVAPLPPRCLPSFRSYQQQDAHEFFNSLIVSNGLTLR